MLEPVIWLVVTILVVQVVHVIIHKESLALILSSITGTFKLNYLAYVQWLKDNGYEHVDAWSVADGMGARGKMKFGSIVMGVLPLVIILVLFNLLGVPFVITAVALAVFSVIPSSLFARFATSELTSILSNYDKKGKKIVGWGLVVAGAVATLGYVMLFLPVNAILMGASAYVLLLVASMIEEYFIALANKSQSVDFGNETKDGAVLLLRSFNDDGMKVYCPMKTGDGFRLSNILWPETTFERMALMRFAGNKEVVAIGRPGEKLPPLGALRTYVPDEKWQDAVKETALRAEMIILVAGSTEGLAWEVRHLRKLDLLPKSLILIPPLYGDETEKRFLQAIKDLKLSEAETEKQNAESFDMMNSPAMSVNADGELVRYTYFGTDWMAYLMAEVAFMSGAFQTGTSAQKKEAMAKMSEEELEEDWQKMRKSMSIFKQNAPTGLRVVLAKILSHEMTDDAYFEKLTKKYANNTTAMASIMLARAQECEEAGRSEEAFAAYVWLTTYEDTIWVNVGERIGETKAGILAAMGVMRHARDDGDFVKYYEMAERRISNDGDKEYLAEVYAMAADYYNGKGDAKKAVSFAKKAVVVLKELGRPLRVRAVEASIRELEGKA